MSHCERCGAKDHSTAGHALAMIAAGGEANAAKRKLAEPIEPRAVAHELANVLLEAYSPGYARQVARALLTILGGALVVLATGCGGSTDHASDDATAGAGGASDDEPQVTCFAEKGAREHDGAAVWRCKAVEP